MEKSLHLGLFLTLSLLLAACDSAQVTAEAAPEDATPAVLPAAEVTDVSAEAATATPESTATQDIENIIRLRDVGLIPFAPPWFEGDIAAVVYAENGLLRIDAPGSPYEPGDQEGLFKSLVFGAVTLESQADFDISVTFNRQGGVCTGHDKCANLAATACIVFGFFDPDNFQIFCLDESSAVWTLDAFVDGIHSATSNLQPADSIHYLSIPIFQYALHPEPNEFRLKMQNNVLSGFVNGEQVFERQGYLPQACRGESGMLICSQGLAGAPCSYAYMEGQAGQNISGCTDLVGKVGVACYYQLPESIAAEQVAQFGFGIGWDVSNCEATLTINP